MQKFLVTDYKAKDDKDAFRQIKNIIKSIGDFEKAGFDGTESFPPKENPEEIFLLFPLLEQNNMTLMKLLKDLFDQSEFRRIQTRLYKTIICATARIDGWSVEL